MKFFVLTFLLIGLFAAILGGILYSQMKVSDQPISLPTPTPATTPNSTATTTAFAPTAFHGPTSEPHIIGPSGPPPNY